MTRDTDDQRDRGQNPLKQDPEGASVSRLREIIRQHNLSAEGLELLRSILRECLAATATDEEFRDMLRMAVAELQRRSRRLSRESPDSTQHGGSRRGA